MKEDMAVKRMSGIDSRMQEQNEDTNQGTIGYKMCWVEWGIEKGRKEGGRVSLSEWASEQVRVEGEREVKSVGVWGSVGGEMVG